MEVVHAVEIRGAAGIDRLPVEAPVGGEEHRTVRAHGLAEAIGAQVEVEERDVTLLGPARTAASRLSLTQGINSLGTTLAPLVGAWLILDGAGLRGLVALAGARARRVPAHRAARASTGRSRGARAELRSHAGGRPAHRHRRPRAHVSWRHTAVRHGAAEPRHAPHRLGRQLGLPLRRPRRVRLQPHAPFRHRRARLRSRWWCGT